MILFYNGLYHGVEPTLQVNKKKNKDKINGRVFLNLSILETHEIKNRKTATGVNIVNLKWNYDSIFKETYFINMGKSYLKKNDICSVLCDKYYEKKDYIIDYKKFCLSTKKW